MIRHPPRFTRTDTLFPYTTLFRSCLFLHGLSDADCDPGRRPVWRYPYRILAATSGESRVIATDLSDAWAHFTLALTNPHFGDPSFQRSEEHTSELQSLMRISYAVFCLKKNTYSHRTNHQ